MKYFLVPFLLAAGVATSASAQTPVGKSQISVSSDDCKKLIDLTIVDATVTSADVVAAGDFTPPDATAKIRALPSFCRVKAIAKPSLDSNIGIEAWLPMENWNGRFLGTGNGGGAGAITYVTGLAEGLKRGFATANTDLGSAPDINSTIDHPERWLDFGFRADHEMTRVGKAITDALYETPVKYSYFQGCSTGGQQAMTIAERYPEDYQGILAGGPALNRTHLHTMFVWNFDAFNETPDSKLTPAKMTLVKDAVLKACAGKDGGSASDGFLTDPRQCKFDPETIPACGGSDNDKCLTAPQITALKKWYAGPTNPRTGERIFAAPPAGAEDVGLAVKYQQDGKVFPSAQMYMFRWAFGADFDPKRFDFDRDLDMLDARLSSILNANSTDLTRYGRNGGKILMYTGSSDAAVPFQDAINYYERVVAARGDLAKTQDSFRYFVVPGMGHCAGGPGLGHFGQPYSAYVPTAPDHDALLSLVKWVENGKAPDKIIATAFKDNDDVTTPIKMERPICAYPKFPQYQSGDPNSAANYQCTERPRGATLAPAPRYLN